MVEEGACVDVGNVGRPRYLLGDCRRHRNLGLRLGVANGIDISRRQVGNPRETARKILMLQEDLSRGLV